jgi:hypothetical protein
MQAKGVVGRIEFPRFRSHTRSPIDELDCRLNCF